MPGRDETSGAPDAAAAVQAQTRVAGRGVVAIAGAKVFFILTAYGIQLALPRILGSPEAFGRYASALSAVSMLNMVLIAATIQSVSKFVSESEADATVRLRQGLRIQLVVGGSLSVALFAAAPVLADFLRDPALAPLLRVSAGVVFAYAIYATCVGLLNGRRRFVQQASLDGTFSTLRTVGILGGAALGFGALGAMTGFAAAALVIMAIALVVVRRDLSGPVADHGHGAVAWRAWLGFMAPIWLYQMFLNGCLQIDVQVLKKAVAEIARAQGETFEAAAAIASESVGFYRAAQTFAFVPYQLILAMTFIVFPMISRATFAEDMDASRRIIRAAMRFSLMVLLSVAAPLAGAAAGVMRLAYPAEYLAGAPALGILVFGLVAFGLFVILATILSSSDQPRVAAAIAAVALALVVVANWSFIHRAPLGHETLAAAASATTLGTTVACLLAAAAVYRRFRALVPLVTVARVLVAATCAFLAARWVPDGTPFLALLALASGFAVYGLALVVLRELGAADLAAVRATVQRKRS